MSLLEQLFGQQRRDDGQEGKGGGSGGREGRGGTGGRALRSHPVADDNDKGSASNKKGKRGSSSSSSSSSGRGITTITGDGKQQQQPGRVWFGGRGEGAPVGSASSTTTQQGQHQEEKQQGRRGQRQAPPTLEQRRGRLVDRAETELGTYQEEGLVHTGTRKRVAASTATNGVLAAGLAVAGGYWAVRAFLHVFHRARRGSLRCLLLDLVPALESCPGLTYWLDFGTLLGVHRDGDIIPHDNDVDVAVLNPRWGELLRHLKAALEPKGYWVKEVHPSEDPNTTFLRVYSIMGVADLFGAFTPAAAAAAEPAAAAAAVPQQQEEEGGEAEGGEAEPAAAAAAAAAAPAAAPASPSSSDCGRNDCSDDGFGSGGDGVEKLSVQLGHGDCCDIPASLVLPTGRMEFRGVSMAVPGDLEGALEYRYGPDWRVPKYMDKGADVVEQQKLYARVFSTLGKLGIKI